MISITIYITTFITIFLTRPTSSSSSQGLAFGVSREYEGDQCIGGVPVTELLGKETVFDALQRVGEVGVE